MKPSHRSTPLTHHPIDFSVFNDPRRLFSIVIFVTNDSFQLHKQELEELSSQRNLNVIVQLCPYEGIEFLYQLQPSLHGHFKSLEKDLFWEAFELSSATDQDTLKKFGSIHLEFLVAILQQNENQVTSKMLALKNLEPHLVKPIGAAHAPAHAPAHEKGE